MSLLLVICVVGMVVLAKARQGGVLELVGATLTLAPIMAIPVCYALGTFT